MGANIQAAIFHVFDLKLGTPEGSLPHSVIEGSFSSMLPLQLPSLYSLFINPNTYLYLYHVLLLTQ